MLTTCRLKSCRHELEKADEYRYFRCHSRWDMRLEQVFPFSWHLRHETTSFQASGHYSKS